MRDFITHYTLCSLYFFVSGHGRQQAPPNQQAYGKPHRDGKGYGRKPAQLRGSEHDASAFFLRFGNEQESQQSWIDFPANGHRGVRGRTRFSVLLPVVKGNLRSRFAACGELTAFLLPVVPLVGCFPLYVRREMASGVNTRRAKQASLRRAKQDSLIN
ncbi:unnamed protein product [Ectocarpus sp. 13 AM-2016]